MTRSIRLLVTAVTLLLLMTAVPLVTAATRVEAAPTAWNGSGPGVISFVDGTTSSPQFSYHYNPAPYTTQTWTFSTVADADGTVSIPYTYAGFHAYFMVQVFLDAFVIHAEGGGPTITHLVNDGPQSCCTPPSAGFGYTGTTDFTVEAGDTYGFTFGGNNFDSNATLDGNLTLNLASFRDPVTVAANTSWPNATLLNPAGVNGTLTQAGEARWFKIPIVPQSQVQVDLNNLDQNFDLTLFRDIGQAFDTLTSPKDLTHLSAEFAGDAFSPSVYSPSVYSPSVYSPAIYSPSVYSPSVYSPSVYSPSVYSPSVYSPSVYSPSVYSPSAAFIDAFSSAQTRSLIGVSAREGPSDESIRSATWNNTGFFYVRVQGRNGASSPTPFHLGLTNTGGPCSGSLSSRATDPTIAGVPGTAKTLILTDRTRLGLTGTAATAFTAKLNQLAASTQGVVVDVRTSPRIVALNQQADTNAACPFAKNLVAQAIRDVVNSFRDNAGTLKYVVIAGGDAVIPFFRYPDAAGLGPESDYVPPVIDTSASQASLRLNNVLGQDAYGALTDLTVKGATLPVPDVAVGRLVETPSEITGMVDDYLGLPGNKLPNPTSSLVTGYDFLTSAADAVQSDFSAGLGAGAGVRKDQLITNQGVPPTTTTGPGGPSRTTSWTATDLSNVLFGSHHDLIFLAGHFSANGALAADYRTSILSTDLAAHPGLLKDSLVISAGCHSGYNLLDGDGVPGVTLGLDWAQAMSQQKATLIAGTGYQYADTDFLAYSAKLYTQLAHQLRSGFAGTPVAIGQALVNAKQDYLAGLANVSGIDLKALLVSTLYGLPMMGLDLPGRATAPVLPPAIATTPAGAGTPGAVLGLRTAELNVPTPLTTQTKPVLDLNGNAILGQNFQWLTGSDGNQTAPAVPALPQQIHDVTSATGDVLRGVGFRSGTYTDTTGVTPLTGAPTTEQNGVHTSFLSPVFFPQKLFTVNYFDALGGSGTDGRTRVVLTPAQYRLDAGSTTTDTERAYSDMGLRLFYSSNTSTYAGNTPALAAPPSITGVTSTVDGSTVKVSAHVTGDPSAGIQQAWLTYTSELGPMHGQWQSIDLTQNAIDSTLWSGDLPLGAQPAADVRFVLQAVNGVGLVSMDNNQGDGYRPVVTAVVSPDPAATTLALGPVSGASYGSTVTVSATLTGAPAGSTVAFALGSGVVSAPTNAAGLATASLVLQDVPGLYSLTASYAGDATHLASDATTTGVSIAKATTTLTLATVPPVGGGSGIATGLTATLLRSSGAPLSQRTVYFVLVGPTGTRVVPAITDSLGRATLGALALPIGTQTVTARFLGTVPLPGGAVTFTDPTYQASVATTTLVVSPLEVVRSAQASLRQLSGLTTTQAVTVGLAVVALQGALISPRWISGGTRLDKLGDPVLLLINSAVKLLLTVNPKVPAVTAAITSLVGVDRALAQNAIADAVAAHGKPAKITLAKAAFASADTAAAQGKTSNAVDLYRNAWLYARDAMAP